VNANGIAKHYDALTALERFRLIWAAHKRHDAQEINRLLSAAMRLYFSQADVAPFATAFKELAHFTFLELLEEVAKLEDALQRWSEGDFIRGKKAIQDRFRQLYLAEGFILQTKAAGWKLFCERLGISPFGLWKDLPGFERLQRALELLEGTADDPGSAFSRADMVQWLTRRRPDRKPELTDADIISAERLADETETLFRDHAHHYGAE
jgi:hypothetical protein